MPDPLFPLRLAPLLVAAALMPGPSLAADDILLTIRPGDTLIGISQAYLDRTSRWPALKKLNRVGDELRLRPGATLRLPAAWLRWTPGRAEVVSVQGTVNGPRGPLAVGDSLAEGEAVDTGAQGLLGLRFRDGATVVLPPATRIRLGALREIPGRPLSRTAIDIDAGSAESAVPPFGGNGSSFEIRSPRIVTAVRGTRFRVGADGEASRHEVLAGRVQVSGAAGGALLAPGQGVRADGGRVGTPVALLPAPDLSALPATLVRTVARLEAPPGSAATAWRWQVAADADFIRLLRDERTTQPAWVVAGLPDGDFHLRLRGIDAAGIEGLDATRPLAVRARPEPPVQLAPAPDGRVAAATFRWTTAEGAASAHLQVARDAAFTQLVVDRDNLTTPTFAADPPLPAGAYHWRVASRRADGHHGPFGDAGRFVVLDRGAVAPPEVADDAVRLSWSGPEDLRYELQVATEREFARPYRVEQVAGTRHVLRQSEAGSQFVRTRPLLPDGTAGQWSASQEFTVPESAPWWLLLLLLPLL